jgi:hypothetical protein
MFGGVLWLGCVFGIGWVVGLVVVVVAGYTHTRFKGSGSLEVEVPPLPGTVEVAG